ncbi:MAG TPA: hypothetical protein VK995_03180 [Oceanipulchritudo sp.]|nr:hypothetical protein [Oceanipulchritudo sp.]
MPWLTIKATTYVNFHIISPKTVKPFLVLAFLAATSLGWAQSPTYRPPPPPTKGTSFEFRFRYLLKPDISFSGFGSVPQRDVYESENNIFLGTERAISYDDGFLGQDYVADTLVEGGLPNQELMPSSNGQATSYFAYTSESQVSADKSSLAYHRYASVGNPEEMLVGSSSGSLGWELNYTKYINRKRSLGIQVGFSFTGFDSRYNEMIQADLLVQEFIHEMADGDLVPDLPDPELDGDGNVVSQDPYVGERVQDPDGTDPLLEWAAGEGDPTEELLDGQAEVTAQADLRSSVYNFRAGPTYALALGQNFGLQVGAGISAIYFAGTFSAFELLTNPAGGEGITTGLTTTDSAEWQVGGYVDANAYYNLTERVSVFSGMQFQSGSTYSQQNEDRHASVDFDSQVYIHAGLGIKF